MDRGIDEREVLAGLAHHKRVWIFERAGWVLMASILAAAMTGVLGAGPLSRATAGDPRSGFWAEYERFQRHQAPQRLRVHVGPDAARGGRIRLGVSRDWIRAIELEHVHPEPASVVAEDDRLLFEFHAAVVRETTITFSFRPEEYFASPAVVSVDGRPELRLRQFVYP